MIGMMRRYRRMLQVGLLVVIAAFVASLFVFGAGGVGDGGDREWIARVNGETIPVDRYQRRYQAYLEAYSQIYRDRFTPELAERMGLSQQVVNDLVQETIVVQRARAEGLMISDEELNAQIQAIPAFQEAGRFSMKRYQEFLKRRGYTATTFEGEVRRELTRSKVENLVKSGVRVSDAEVERTYALQREEIRAAWAFVDLQPILTATTASDEELAKHLKENEAQFRQPERRRVQYVVVSPKDFQKPVADADVETYYKEHAAEFESPRQVRVAHVLARVPETGGSEGEDRAKAKAADAIRRAKAGEDFAKLARELSEDPGSGKNGGDLGFVKKGEVVPEFEKAAFALKKGEITPEPVRTGFGFHAIKVLDVREGGRVPLAEAAPTIKERLAAQNAERAARAKAEELKPLLQAAPDFMAEAKKLGVSAVETRMPRVEAPPGMPRGESMEDAAFSLAVGGVSSPVKTPAGFIVMKVVEHLPAAVPPLGDIREQVAAAVKRQKAEGVALERAKQVATEAKAGDFAAAAKKVGAQTGETARFSRVKPAEKLPGDTMLAALQTVVNGVTDPVKTPQGYYVLKVLERAPADLTELDKERDKVRTELTMAKQSQAWESWIGTARGSSKIDISSRVQTRRG
ncbi:MAG: SurA N-terminal domain-containing protein [Candidatus Rokubacteria bacterium]|nr:SurA N-terminal domain-containing protein [Candidatus Rokubacteria bacterium]